MIGHHFETGFRAREVNMQSRSFFISHLYFGFYLFQGLTILRFVYI